ncbi:MAG: GNAT family N-acetyltransferase [Oscillospiraceae bacterium]|nr:GNAT family N-acetyltransferase [Oscillospiraceae bacterium]
MNIDYPSPSQIPQLRSLWKAAFGDEDDFLDAFYSIAYSPDRCRCLTLDGSIAAALYWFETSFRGTRFAYIYGVATDPAYRGQGLCRTLMDDARNILKNQGFDGIILYPATENLSRMYAKMGYTHWTTVSEFTCEAAEEAEPLLLVEKEEYAALRRMLLPEGSLIQEKEDLDLLASLAAFFSGSGILAAVTVMDEKLICHELLGSSNAAPRILRSLGCKSGFFRTPGGEKPFAMGISLTENCPIPTYLGLPLD